jgi:hypothetical protein
MSRVEEVESRSNRTFVQARFYRHPTDQRPTGEVRGIYVSRCIDTSTLYAELEPV